MIWVYADRGSKSLPEKSKMGFTHTLSGRESSWLSPGHSSVTLHACLTLGNRTITARIVRSSFLRFAQPLGIRISAGRSWGFADHKSDRKRWRAILSTFSITIISILEHDPQWAPSRSGLASESFWQEFCLCLWVYVRLQKIHIFSPGNGSNRTHFSGLLWAYVNVI